MRTILASIIACAFAVAPAASHGQAIRIKFSLPPSDAVAVADGACPCSCEECPHNKPRPAAVVTSVPAVTAYTEVPAYYVEEVPVASCQTVTTYSAPSVAYYSASAPVAFYSPRQYYTAPAPRYVQRQSTAVRRGLFGGFRATTRSSGCYTTPEGYTVCPR